MADVRDRLQRLEKLVAEKLVCAACSTVAIVVIGPGEDGAARMPAPCSACGRERNVIVVQSPLPRRAGSMRKAARDGTDPLSFPEIVTEDTGEAESVRPLPAPTKRPEQRRPADGLPRSPRWVPRHEIPVEPAPARKYEPFE